MAYWNTGNSLADKYAKVALGGNIPKVQTQFTKLVPMESVVNEPAISSFGYSRVDPEIGRMRIEQNRNLGNMFAQSGGLRFGTANRKRQELSDSLSRQREEMALPFIQSARQRLTDYYNELYKDYYTDPNSFQYKPVETNKILSSLY